MSNGTIKGGQGVVMIVKRPPRIDGESRRVARHASFVTCERVGDTLRLIFPIASGPLPLAIPTPGYLVT